MCIQWHDAHDNAFICMWISRDILKERVWLEQSDATEIFQEVISWDNDLSKINIKLDFYVKQAKTSTTI